MKRYVLFTGYTYYPSGGWDDFAGWFDTIDEMKDFLVKHVWRADWAHYYDTEQHEKGDLK